jgi:hypothetical protein
VTEDFPDHTDRVPPDVLELIERMHWQNARSVERVARHSYRVAGWDRDDVTETEFWRVVDVVRAVGRIEVWTAPAGFYDSGRRPQLTNRYMYVPPFAYWYTTARSATHMLNREHVDVQLRSPTRSLPGADVGVEDELVEEQLRLDLE